VEEALEILDKYLDDAVVADLPYENLPRPRPGALPAPSASFSPAIPCGPPGASVKPKKAAAV
jgi:hypothetical protein